MSSERTNGMDKLPSLAESGFREIATFDPKKTHMRVAAMEGAIKHAKKIEDWESLDEAVHEVVAEQRAFVEWWDDKVTVGRNAKLAQNAVNADRCERHIPVGRAEKETHIKQQQVSRWRIGLKDEDKYRTSLRGPSFAKAWANKDDVRGTQGSGEDEWRTPQQYIDLARDVMNGIDCDPATHPQAQEIIHAATFFTKQTNGLAQEWHGRVWLNPPYSQPLIADFVNKVEGEYLAGRVSAAIVLTHNYSDTKWFHKLASVDAAMCFTLGRIKFLGPDGEVGNPTQGQTFHYLGQDVDRFIEKFSTIGFVVRRAT